MTTIVEVQLVEGLGLPYTAGAEVGFLDAALDPIFDVAWQAFVATFPGLTLVPLFDGLPVEQLADLVDGIRVDGNELSIAKDPAGSKVPGDGTFRAINGTVSSGPSDSWLTPDGSYLYQIYGNASKLVGTQPNLTDRWRRSPA